MHKNRYNDECYTSIGSDAVLRGCVSEREYSFAEACRNDTDKCEICTSIDDDETNVVCNKKPIKIEMCIECSLANGDNCLGNFDMYRNKICSGIGSTVAVSEGCYVHIVS